MRRAYGASPLHLLAHLAALALAGWALRSGSEARRAAAPRAEVERLRAGLDSLRARVPADTARAAAPDSLPAAVGARTPQTPTPTAP